MITTLFHHFMGSSVEPDSLSPSPPAQQGGGGHARFSALLSVVSQKNPHHAVLAPLSVQIYCLSLLMILSKTQLMGRSPRGGVVMWDCDDLDDDDHDVNEQAPKLVPRQGEGQRRVGMVGRGVPGSGSGQGFLNQLLKQTQVPKFSGDPIQFGSWKWQFDRFLRDAETTYGKLTESQKLTALENALPEKYRERLIMLQRMGKPVHCEAFWPP